MATSTSVANAPLGSYPVRRRETSNGQIQVVSLDIGDGVTESAVTSSNPLPVTFSGGTSDPLEEYKISDLDESAATKYYGMIKADGNWFILQLTSTAARYIKGASSYATNWTNRASLTYDYFDAIF